MKKSRLMIATSLALCLCATTAFATQIKNIDDTEFMKSVTDENIEMSIVRHNDDGTDEISLDGGETWRELDSFEHFNSNDLEIEWRTLTVEDIEKRIDDTKKEMADDEFMNWMEELNDITKEDMENIINHYEQQIEDIKNGIVIEEGICSDGTTIIGSFNPNDVDTMTMYGFGATFTDVKTGEAVEYTTDNLIELKIKLEKAYKDGNITKEDYNKIINDLEMPSQEIVTIESLMKKFEKFGVTFEPEDNNNYSGNIYYNGVLVKSLTDINPNGSTTSMQSRDGGKIHIQSVYDEDGNLTGIKEV